MAGINHSMQVEHEAVTVDRETGARRQDDSGVVVVEAQPTEESAQAVHPHGFVRLVAHFFLTLSRVDS